MKEINDIKDRINVLSDNVHDNIFLQNDSNYDNVHKIKNETNIK